MPKIEIADGLTLPPNAAVQVYAFMGRRGSGKTYGAGRLVEQVIAAGGQVAILDPVGTWWGLRLAADGKSPGIPVPVFGGLHGDIPLEATAGKVVAELAAERGTSLVLDVSSFTGADQRRFIADFATEFFQAKKSHRSAVLVVMEEAQEFAPQRVGGETARMVGAVERMIKLGRNFGIGTALVSQRPQAINKDVLNQSEVMFCFQMTGPQERKTIEGWVQEKGAGGRDIGDQLPSLPVGTALMWSPQWLGLFGKYKIAPKRTYDASATPDMTKERAPRPLAPIDLDAVRESMAATVEAAKANDPAELRREVARLRAELAKKPATATTTKTVEAIGAATLKRLEFLAEKVEAAEARFTETMRKEVERLAQPQQAITAELGNVVALARRAAMPASSIAAPRWSAPPPVARRYQPSNGNHGHAPAGDVGKGERRILAAVAQHAGGVTREQLTVLTGYKRSSRDTYLQRLRTADLVAIPNGGDTIVATDVGVAALGDDFEPLPTGAELRRHWLERLPEGERAILDIVCAAYPRAVERDAISAATDYKRSSRDTYLQRLSSRKLIVSGHGGITASAELF